jgi:sugar lactone lactonase YvrE
MACAMNQNLFDPQPLPVPPSRLGESPFWHPQERALYWCDIPGRRVNRFRPLDGQWTHWDVPSEPACAAPLRGGGLLLAMRDGLWRFDTVSGERSLVAPPPYDPALERFNDGKADALGRFWAGTIYEPRDPARAALYLYEAGGWRRMAGDIVNSNGLAWSPDGRTLYWADTRGHCIRTFAMNLDRAELSAPQLLAQFDPRQPGQSLDAYGGRPDGAAVDAEGAYWCAMYEGQRLLRLSPEGRVLRELRLPVRCPTMPCFGDDDLRTLYVTTAREGRPADELAAQPWAGQVLRLRVDVPGLPVHYAVL